MFDKFNQVLGFTQTEGRVVLFLVAAFVIGVSIKVVKGSWMGSTMFDYSAADSEFAARSQLLDIDTVSNNDDITKSEGSGVSSDTAKAASKLIDINSAAKSDLTALPGIGDAMAERIIRYREEHGRFSSPDDLMHVKGIGKKKLARIKPFCMVKR
jgi:comEA protein